jgi:hypothetical protein
MRVTAIALGVIVLVALAAGSSRYDLVTGGQHDDLEFVWRLDRWTGTVCRISMQRAMIGTVCTDYTYTAGSVAPQAK